MTLYYHVNDDTELTNHLLNLRIELSPSHEQENSLPWHLPRSADQFFGRQQEIIDVATLLKKHPRLALIGPGGMGKTALAAEAIRHLAPGPEQPGPFPGGIYSHDYYQLAEHPHALNSILVQAGKSDTDDANKPAVVAQILDQPGVLLYLEGCEKADDLDALLALAGQARVLITTHDQQKRGDAHPHVVHPLDELGAGKLLHHPARLVEFPPQPEAQRPWLELATKLGRHPLALRLSGATMQEQGDTPAEFSDVLSVQTFGDWADRDGRKENLLRLFAHTAKVVDGKDARALEAWYALALHGPAPVPLSALCGALGNEGIGLPEELIKRLRKTPDLPKELRELLAMPGKPPIAPEEVKKMFAVLVRYSVAEPCEFLGDKDGTMERAWQFTHALPGEWGRNQWLPKTEKERGLQPASPTASEATLKRPEGRAPLQLRYEEILRAWRAWWRKDLNRCWDYRAVPGGPLRYAALQPHWESLLRVLAQYESVEQCELSAEQDHLAEIHRMMGSYSLAQPLHERALATSAGQTHQNARRRRR